MNDNLVRMEPQFKDGDGGDNDNFIEGIHIEPTDNGFIVSSFDAEDEYKQVFVKGRDDQELIQYLKDNLGIK